LQTASGLAACAIDPCIRLGPAAPPTDDHGVVTGDTDHRLAPYDNLMARFMDEHRPPGAALAVVKDGRLVYARGFGYANVEKKEPVQPASLFRIASISKPFTSTACFRLIEQGKLSLDAKVFDLLGYRAPPLPGAKPDPRLYQVTVRQCLQHTGGWDRDKSVDPMSNRTAGQISRALKTSLPIKPEQIIRYMMTRPLDFDPGSAFAYSNFGYCILGRVIAKVSGRPYAEFVARQVLEPAGIHRMRLGKNLLADRAPGEVHYYDSKNRTSPMISGPRIGATSPLPYGGEPVETMDANGGWIASTIDLARFAAALEDPQQSKLLNASSIRTMLAAPTGSPGHRPNGQVKPTYYGCGWNIRPINPTQLKYTKWHTGLLSGTSTLLVCRPDRISWAVLFNCDADSAGKNFADLIDPLLHGPADQIKNWPEHDLFQGKYRDA
jgi:N-acyl-D-amino-acid deacylase